ncbi:unnamed protein product [Closterium sp. Naga37s-1]|nr:unnamed protein product [Closterium sp. Naga37s-1]
MKPPVLPAPKPVTTVAGMPPPLRPEAPAAVTAPVQSAPVAAHVAAPSAPAAAAVPLAPPVEPPVFVPAEIVPVPNAPVPPPAAVPALPSPVVALSPQVASTTTGNQALVEAPLVADPSVPAVPPTVPGGQQIRSKSPDRRSSRPHSPAPRQERESSRRRLAGVEFVAAGGGAARAQYPPLVAGSSASLAADEPLLFLAEALQPPQARVLEATLGELFRLADILHTLLLIQVLAHMSLPAIPSESFHDRPRVCLDAADQLALLLAPVLAAPSEGGVAAAGELDEAVRGLRRHLRAGSGAAAIGASTLVVRELWRTLTGVLHALGAHRM